MTHTQATLNILLHYPDVLLLLIGLWGMFLCLPAQILINKWVAWRLSRVEAVKEMRSGNEYGPLFAGIENDKELALFYRNGSFIDLPIEFSSVLIDDFWDIV